MIFWTIVQFALRSLAANKLRSLLAMLGIIIGVWSVISALALAAGAQKKVVDQMSTFGSNVLEIWPRQNGTAGVISGRWATLKVGDALAVLKIPEVARSAPVVYASVQLKRGDKNAQTFLIGTSAAFFAIRNNVIARGRMISDGDCDDLARVAVMGSTTVKNLFGYNSDDTLGRFMEVKGVRYRIVGILQSKGGEGFDWDPDDVVIIPYTTAMNQVVGTDHLNQMIFSAKDPARLGIVQAKVTLLLRKRHRLADNVRNDFGIFNMAAAIRATSTVSVVLSLLLGGIAGITLLVGGIGVMNIMLVTVTERTREIGVRKAIGAKRRDILRQFLIESVVMSGMGGLIGIVLGVATALVVSASQSYIALIVTPGSILLSLGFSAGIGIFFGYYPARRAAGLDPIEALRYE